MSFFRVTEPNVAPVLLADLGITIAQAAAAQVLSDQFTAQELVRSADMEAAIIGGDLTVEIDYGTGYQSVAAGDYTNRDCLAAFLNVYEITNENNNEDLVDGSEVNASGPASAPLHIHDARYYTETELGAAGGAALIGASSASCSVSSATNVQDYLDDLCSAIAAVGDDLDSVYNNDADGIMNVDGTTKDLEFRSDDLNDVAITRDDGSNVQDFLRADVSADELLLGALADASNPQVDARVLGDLYVDGDITFVGTITDTTVNELNVTNANIIMREGAATGADASLQVERGSTGADASLRWNETADRWMAGLEGADYTIALLELDETVSGVWNFGGDDDTEPNLWLVEKDPGTPPSTKLGAAGQIPMAMMEDGILAVYDKSNSRNKWLSTQREFMSFSGRNTSSNKNEYLWVGRVNTMQTGIRLQRAATLVGITVQSEDTETYTIRVRKNNAATNLASIVVTAADGNESSAENTDFAKGDEVQVYLDSANNVTAPIVRLEFAYKY